jgi:hypothetical protein
VRPREAKRGRRHEYSRSDPRFALTRGAAFKQAIDWCRVEAPHPLFKVLLNRRRSSSTSTLAPILIDRLAFTVWWLVEKLLNLRLGLVGMFAALETPRYRTRLFGNVVRAGQA